MTGSDWYEVAASVAEILVFALAGALLLAAITWTGQL